MTSLKMIGCVLIFISAAGVGNYASIQLGRRKRQLAALRRGILSLIREIDFQLAPLSEAMLYTAGRTENPWNDFFEVIGRRLASGENKVNEIMKEEIKRLQRRHPWKQDLEILLTLGNGLGELDKTMQLSQLRLMEAEVMEAEREAAEEQKRKSRLYQSLGVCMGMLGIIILL